MTESFRLRHVNWIVGLFLLIIISAFLVIVLFMTSAKGLLDTNVLYTTNVPQENLGSLKKGAEVILLGEVVGRVSEMKFGDDQIVIVTSSIRDTYKNQIIDGSEVLIIEPIAVGSPHLKIMRGPAGGAPIAASLEIPGNLPLDESTSALGDVGNSVGQGMAQIVDNFDRARSAIVWGMNAFRSLSQTTERSVDPAMNELRQAIAELRATTERSEVTLKHTLEDIAETARTMNDRTKSSSQNLDSNIEEMQQSMAVVERASVERLKGIQQSLDKLNADIERAVDSFESVMVDIKKISPDLPDTKDSIDNAVSDADDVIDGVKRHPLLRKYVDQEKGTRQAAPSSVRGGTP
jgi:ABC-type transporter Mla subunit MlaD